MVEKISQHVDTLKFHYKVSNNISDDNLHGYNESVENLIRLKKEAQTLANDYGDVKSVVKEFGSHRFQVLSKAIQGFSVVIRSNDVSLAFRKVKNKASKLPIIKAEFRAEFLARKGYKKAIEIVNNFVKEYLLSEYEITISEIHLATDIQGYHFTFADFFRMKTRSRNSKAYEEETEISKSSLYGKATAFSGFTFGGGDYHFRVYNKTMEIAKFKNKGFAKPLLWDTKPNYDPNSTVWRLEIQIRRAKLKKLVNSDNSTMDNYDNILNAIPDLWKKALTDYTIKDISDRHTYDIFRGKKTLKNGTEKPLTKNAIYQIFKRADDLPFWEELKLWNGWSGDGISTAYNLPKSGSFVYVANSIKSLYSTAMKHYGSFDSNTLIEAFKQANDECVDRKGVSLIEDVMGKQFDWFERIEHLINNGVCDVPLYKDLEDNIYGVVFKANEVSQSYQYSAEFKERLGARRRTKNEKVIDHHLNRGDYENKIEARRAF